MVARWSARQPFVRGDSVLGRAGRDTTGVAITEIRSVAVERFDWLKSAGAAVLTFGITMGVACALACEFGEIGFSLGP